MSYRPLALKVFALIIEECVPLQSANAVKPQPASEPPEERQQQKEKE
jgi:hypothetical protein